MTQQDIAPRHGTTQNRDELAQASFDVEFGMRAGMTTVPADTFQFIGKGQVVFDGNTVTISGARKRAFQRKLSESHAFGRDEIVNATLSGDTVRFQLHREGTARRTVQFRVANAVMAHALLACLPAQQTPDFAQAMAALVDFHERLDRFSPRALVTPTLVALNVLVFLAMCIAGMNPVTPDGEMAVRWGSDFGPLTLGGQWWRLFTSTFIHFGVIHLALNMLALYQNGRTIERLFGSARFLLLYVFAGLTGSLASLLWNPMVNGAGASGAIFGVFGGMLAFVINPRNDVPKEVMTEHRNSTLLFAGYSLFYGFIHSGIDNAAHIGGLVGGFAMGLLLARPLNAEHRSRNGVPKLLMASAAGVLVLLLMAWPLANPNGRAQVDGRFQRSLTAFSTREKTALDAVNALIGQAKNGTLSDQAFAAQVQKNIVPQWDALYTDVASAQLSADNRNYPMQQALLHYVDARREELRAYVQLASNDSSARASMAAAQQRVEAATADINRLSGLEK